MDEQEYFSSFSMELVSQMHEDLFDIACNLVKNTFTCISVEFESSYWVHNLVEFVELNNSIWVKFEQSIKELFDFNKSSQIFLLISQFELKLEMWNSFRAESITKLYIFIMSRVQVGRPRGRLGSCSPLLIMHKPYIYMI